jgi:hypothetical protein
MLQEKDKDTDSIEIEYTVHFNKELFHLDITKFL